MLIGCAAVLAVGCVVGPRVELAAADSIAVISAEMERALNEYHADLSRLDDDRERQSLQAFLDRLRQSGSAEAPPDGQDEREFLAALRRIRVDRETERLRYDTARDNLEELRHVAAGLRRFAIQSLSLESDVQKHFETLAAQAARTENPKPPPATAAADSKEFNDE